MIYFFDNELNMVKVATSKNVISAVHEHELNGLILATLELDMKYGARLFGQGEDDAPDRNFIPESRNGIYLQQNYSAASGRVVEYDTHSVYYSDSGATAIDTYTLEFSQHPAGTDYIESVWVRSPIELYAGMQRNDLSFHVRPNTWTQLHTKRTATGERMRVRGIYTDRPVVDGLEYRHYMNHLGREPFKWRPAASDLPQAPPPDYFGYYYKSDFYLHKIKRVEHEHENELIRITGRHIFFEDMLYGDYIRDVRPENRDALYILNQTISANTRWQPVMTDTSKVHTANYYWVPPMEVINDLTENVGIEYEPRILFDGQNINGFQLHVANRIGEDTPIRVPFGSRVLSLKHEVDYSEIVTALYGHGKGEEVGDGYGRRINFRDVDFSRNGVVSHPGSLFMENPEITAQYGKDDGSPKFGRIVFEDVEDEQELANATYEAYLEQSRPKMLFEASVADLGDVGMGDGVLIIRREYDVYFNARIHKLMVDLLEAENADVELGDYAHFKESKVQRKTRESNNQYRRQTSNRIQQIKEQFNERFDGEVAQMREDFEQALIDAHAEIQASEQRMTELIGNERASLQTEIDDKTNDAREYADTQIADKEAQYEADWNQRDADIQQSIETVVGGSVDALDTNLLDVNSRLFQTHNDLIERINNIDTQSFNLIRGSRFDEVDRYATSGGTVHDDEDMPYFRYGLSSENIQYISTVDDIQFESGKTYTFSLDYRTSSNVVIDYLRIIATDGSANVNIRDHIGGSGMAGIIPDGEWHRTFLTFTVPRNLTGNLRIGSEFTSGTKAQIDIRLPYLTTSGNTQWVFHPSDSYESIMSIMTRLDEFEARVENDLAGVSGELSSAREALQAQLDDAKAELEGLEVGGRNLIPNSVSAVNRDGLGSMTSQLHEGVQTPIGVYDIRSYTNLTSTLLRRSNNVNFESGRDHIFSVYVRTVNEGDTADIGLDISDIFMPMFTVTNEWRRIHVKATKEQLANTDRRSLDVSIWTENTPVFVAFWQLETGNKMTPWTPAPEDTEQKITSLNEQIEYIDGELEAKLNRTEIEPLQDKITEYGLTLDANAESISLLQDKTELHDDDITMWSNLAESTAEEMSRTLTRISEIDGEIESIETDIYVNAESIGGLLTRVSNTESSIADINISVDGITADFANYKQDIDSDVGALSAQVASYEASVDGFRAEVGMLQGDIDDVDSWIAEKGAVIDGTAEAISARVWQRDIDAVEVGGRNLLRDSRNIMLLSNESSVYPIEVDTSGENYKFRRVLGSNNTALSTYTQSFFTAEESGTYTQSIKVKPEEDITLRITNGGTSVLCKAGEWTLLSTSYELTSGQERRVLGLYGTHDYEISNPWIEYKEWKVEKGNKATDWTPAPEDTLMKTDFVLESDGFLLGGNYVGGDHYSTAIVGDADGLKLLGDTIIDGNLYVKDRVQSFAMEAVEGEFARLWADEFEATTITGDHIDGNTITGNHLRVDGAMVDKLIADTAFANDIQTLSLNAVRGDIADLRSRILTSEVIETDHIRWNNALFNRLTGDEAFIDRLEVKAANIRDLTGTHIRGGLLDSLNGNTRFNLNTGRLTMENTYFELGGGATIRFTHHNNDMLYSLYDSDAGYARVAGMGVGRSVNNTLPFAYLGTYAGATMDTLGPHFSGLFVNTTTRIRENDSANSIMGQRFRINRDQDFSDFLEFDMFGTNTIKAYGTWDIGEPGLGFRRAYINNARSSNDFFNIVYAYDGSRLGYRFELTSGASSGNAAFRPEYGGELFYNLGTSTHVWRRGYINVLHYNTLEQNSLRELKDYIEDLDVEDAKDYIRNTDIQTFYYKSKNDDNPRTEYDMKVGIIHDDINIEKDYLIKSSESTVDQSNITFMIQSVVKDNLSRLDNHELMIESNAEKIKRLEKEIETLKGA